jgi:HJR/Mrr/RecB family endonuclease
LQRIAQSRWWQLPHSNWRDLRGVAFEIFLKEVFELLGHSVQTTKASGDMGINFVLTGKGQKVGVQCKGYADGAGSKAVMEALAGRRTAPASSWTGPAGRQGRWGCCG